ncbi:MAG: PilZ domain-containing protein [Candidatus Omnitrophica bacterium]|nr:PilZ domain-containing protein [Candidatus Omnitrophota bacterium]
MAEKKERRRYPRIKDNNIGVKLSGEGFNAITQSLDVSASGIYCKVDRRVPIMTKVQVVVSLPGKGKSSTPTTLNLDGVVVREHPVNKNGHVDHYDIAIFFNTLLPRERDVLVRHIDRQLK